MMRRLLPHPLLTGVLTVVWLLLVNSTAPGQIMLGLLMGWSLPLFTRRFWPERVVMRRPLTLLRFIGVVLYDVVTANLNVARLILGSPRRLRPAFVEVPLDIRSELGVSLLANTVSLTPGTVSARLSSDRRVLLVHALDVTDIEGLIAAIKRRYETPLMEIFETC